MEKHSNREVNQLYTKYVHDPVFRYDILDKMEMDIWHKRLLAYYHRLLDCTEYVCNPVLLENGKEELDELEEIKVEDLFTPYTCGDTVLQSAYTFDNSAISGYLSQVRAVLRHWYIN